MMAMKTTTIFGGASPPLQAEHGTDFPTGKRSLGFEHLTFRLTISRDVVTTTGRVAEALHFLAPGLGALPAALITGRGKIGIRMQLAQMSGAMGLLWLAAPTPHRRNASISPLATFLRASI